MDTVSSSSITRPPSYPSESSTASLRDASFLSYVNSTEETYINSLRLKTVEDGEIDVFSADKYFNGVIDQETNIETSKYHQQSRENPTDKATISLSKIKLRPRTPSVHSDSSLNSQSALIRPVQRNISRKEKKTSFFMSCYCCDKKSVDVEDGDRIENRGGRSFDNEVKIKTSFDTAEITRLNKLRLDRTDPFAYLETNQLTSVKTIQEEEEEKRRKKSIEVFGYNDELDTNRRNTTSYDIDSDASSDLFEIPCLSCNASPARNGPIGYAPSEASIDWSVITASAADNSTVLDTEDQMSSTMPTGMTGHRTGAKPNSYVKELLNKGGQKTRSVGMLSGCKSQKAVDVQTSNVKRKSGESQKVQRFSDSYDNVTRFQVEAKLNVNGLSQSNRISGSHSMYN
ncbi:hypothetical protein RND81_07G183300 [Saponaria officinalis]|uniref:Protein PHYTOCHROME KINASE SUBSTRATE 1-like n=1 Tax=Saponaria officinalis TaxID=3572 RepID=A0AAW1JV19_SAPOF